jgi:glutathione S-transferase
MELYFSPMACSLASRIACYEAGAEIRYIEVDPQTKLTRSGDAFRAINPLGLVPTLRTDDGEVLTENAAILQYIADSFPSARLAPAERLGRTRLSQWLCFIGTELHKSLFAPLLDPKAPEAVKAYALENGRSRLDYLERHLTGRELLLDELSVADAYLVAVLNWSLVTPVKLKEWPAIAAYHERLRSRPAFARAIAEEFELFREETARHVQVA